MTLDKRSLENTEGKGENAGNQHFLLFSTVFSTLSKRENVILATFKLSSANAFNLVMSKILFFGKGLMGFHEALNCFLVLIFISSLLYYQNILDLSKLKIESIYTYRLKKKSRCS